MAIEAKLNKRTSSGWETIHPETTIDQVIGLNTALANAGSSIDSLNDITDVNVPNPSDGQALVWDNTNSEWIASTITTNSGDITSVVAGTGLSGGGTSGDVTLNLDLSEFTDMTADIDGLVDEIILLDNGAERRKAIAEFKLSQFNNDSGWTSNVGDITNVTAGSGLTGGGTSGSVTLNVGAGTGITVAADTVAVDTSVIATQAYVNTAVANLVDSSPATLDTLNELAAALGDDPNFATTVTNSIATKLPLAGGTLTGTLTTRAIAMQNYSLTGVGSISINDPGPNEGIFFGGNFSVYESPDDLTTNSSGNLQFVSGGTRRFTIGTSGDLYAGGRFSNGAVWIANGSDNNSYNENIRLFAAPNGVSVIAFNATGTSGTPVSSILGFSDRLEERIGSTWRTRLYSSGLQVNGTITEGGTLLSAKYLGISATAVNSDKVDGYHIVVGSTGTDTNTLYFTT